MTPAIKLLKQKKIKYEILQYKHDQNVHDFGHEAVDKLGLLPHETFKTLLVDISKRDLVTCVVSVDKHLCLKSVAEAFGVKKAHMADKEKAQKSSGYLLGGISPLGQKKKLRTLIQKEAKNLPFIYVSGGKRGLDIKLNPQDLATLTDAKFCDIATS